MDAKELDFYGLCTSLYAIRKFIQNAIYNEKDETYKMDFVNFSKLI